MYCFSFPFELPLHHPLPEFPFQNTTSRVSVHFLPVPYTHAPTLFFSTLLFSHGADMICTNPFLYFLLPCDYKVGELCWVMLLYGWTKLDILSAAGAGYGDVASDECPQYNVYYWVVNAATTALNTSDHGLMSLSHTRNHGYCRMMSMLWHHCTAQ